MFSCFFGFMFISFIKGLVSSSKWQTTEKERLSIHQSCCCENLFDGTWLVLLPGLGSFNVVMANDCSSAAGRQRRLWTSSPWNRFQYELNNGALTKCHWVQEIPPTKTGGFDFIVLAHWRNHPIWMILQTRFKLVNGQVGVSGNFHPHRSQ